MNAVIAAPVITVNGAPLDPSLVALPLSIRQGRSGTSAQPDAPICEFTWIGETVPFKLNDDVVITLELPTPGTGTTWGSPVASWADPGVTWDGSQIGQSTRFVGSVTALIAQEQGQIVYEWQVGCTGTLARLGTVNVNISRPAETDVQRVQAIAAAAGIEILTVGTDSLNLTADGINRDALSALHEVCSWTGGILFQGKGGQVVYGTMGHRTGPAQATIPAGAILDGVSWATTADEVLNHIVVTFGDPETQNTYRDDDSIAEWGYRHVEVGTKLAATQDANEFGQTLLIRRAQPYWVMPGVMVNSEDCSPPEFYEVNLLSVGTGVILPVPETPGPITPGGVATWTVEGWVEQWDTAYTQQMQISVSDRQRWGAYVLNRWSGMAAQDWQYWADLTWLEQLTGGSTP